MSVAPVVVISGQIAAGKTTAGKILRARGFQYARISQAIKTRWNSDHGGKPPRSWYQSMGMKLHRDIGQRGLCHETLGFIPDPTSTFVVDGARWKEDVAFFQECFGKRVSHVHLTAPTGIRKKRFENLEKDVSFEEADADEVEREVAHLFKEADAVFDNRIDDLAPLTVFLDTFLKRVANAC